MGLKKLGQDVAITVNGNTSAYLRNCQRNRNQAQIDTTGLEDAALNYKTSQGGAKDVEITGEIMHPKVGEPADQVHTDIMAAIEDNGTVDVVYDGKAYDDMCVIGGEDSVGPDEVYVTKFTMKLTAAPVGS